MAYSQSPFDDQYGLDEWIRQQAESAPLDALASSADPMQPPPMAAFQAPPHAEMAPLQLNTGPDWSDALGAGTTALATLADLGLNHGRGTGQILAAGGQFGQARAEQRLKGTQDALAYEEKRAALDKSNKYNDYLYANMAQRGQNQSTLAQQRGQNIDLRARDVSVKEANSARAAENQDPSEFIAWAKDKGYDLSGLQTMSQARSAMGPLMKEWDLAHAGDKAKATREGTIVADLNAAPDVTAVAVDKAGKIAAAEAPYKVGVAEDSAAARERGQQRGQEQAGAKMRIPGLVPIDEQAAAQSAGDPTTLRKIQDAGGALATARGALQDMATLRKQYGTELPGEAKTRFDMAQVAINGALTELGRTGVLSDKERAYYMSMIPNLSLGWTDALRPGGVDIKQQQLAGAMQEFGSLANGKLRAYGWGLEGGGGSRPQPSAAPGNGPSTRAPGQAFDVPLGPRGYDPKQDPLSNVNPGGDSLGTVPVQRLGGGRQQAAQTPIGGQAAGGMVNGGTVRMVDPEGEVGDVPADQVQAALSAGYRQVQ